MQALLDGLQSSTQRPSSAEAEYKRLDIRDDVVDLPELVGTGQRRSANTFSSCAIITPLRALANGLKDSSIINETETYC